MPLPELKSLIREEIQAALVSFENDRMAKLMSVLSSKLEEKILQGVKKVLDESLENHMQLKCLRQEFLLDLDTQILKHLIELKSGISDAPLPRLMMITVARKKLIHLSQVAQKQSRNTMPTNRKQPDTHRSKKLAKLDHKARLVRELNQQQSARAAALVDPLGSVYSDIELREASRSNGVSKTAAPATAAVEAKSASPSLSAADLHIARATGSPKRKTTFSKPTLASQMKTRAFR
eukprot:jgi/Hompol1/4397/HPOL_001047-RA